MIGDIFGVTLDLSRMATKTPLSTSTSYPAHSLYTEPVSDEPPTVPASLLRPFVSVIVLVCPDDASPGAAFNQIAAKLAKLGSSSRSRKSVQVVASGLDIVQSDNEPELADAIDQHQVLVYRVESRPSWLKEQIFVDVSHEIAILFRINRYVVVHAPTEIRTRILAWLDKSPRPMLRRVPANIFEQALLRGESRGLWLKGTHARRKSKADSKNIVGADLRQSLSPIEDQTYALNSARSVLETTKARTALKGTVGTTPTSSLVWNKQATDFETFVKCARELVDLIDETCRSTAEDVPIFPLLTHPVLDISSARGAYEISYSDPDDLPAETIDDSIVKAAGILESATLIVHGRPDSPDFDIDVGMNGSIGGLVRATFHTIDGEARLVINLASGPSDPVMAEPVVWALRHTELLTLYYASGHTFTQHTLYKPHIESRPFPNWRWSDFSGYDTFKEKPGYTDWSPERIHSSIGTADDKSLFSWVQNHYSQGWLTCDDGPGEVADFVHLDEDGTLRLIHVKAAKSGGPMRSVSATAFEVVVSQAVKNSIFLDTERLTAHLSVGPPFRASWTSGARVPNRRDLIDLLQARDVRDNSEVVIVQPHVSKATYDRLYALDDAG